MTRRYKVCVLAHDILLDHFRPLMRTKHSISDLCYTPRVRLGDKWGATERGLLPGAARSAVGWYSGLPAPSPASLHPAKVVGVACMPTLHPARTQR